MHFQFLIEDSSTEKLIIHIMHKLVEQYADKEITFDIKLFSGIGYLSNSGTITERKGKGLLNSLPSYLRGFDKKLSGMPKAMIVIVLDNDKRNVDVFQQELDNVVHINVVRTDCSICIAVKEMEAWLLGDEKAILEAYPKMAKKKSYREYQQDGICDTWEVLADAVYKGGLVALQKKARNEYSEIGKAKCEWANEIGKRMNLNNNKSPSFQRFISTLKAKIEVA